MQGHITRAALGADAPLGAGAAWLSNDRANHRVALISAPAIHDDPDKPGSARIQHVAFEYATVEDLLDTERGLKQLGITPLLGMDHGATTALYYADPDGNSVELQVDGFADWDQST